MLVCRREERHVGHALVSLGREAYLIRRPVPPYVPASVADLAQLARIVSSKRGRLLVLKVVRSRTCLALWCLYPEPGATRVEYKLVRLSPAAEVDR